MGRGQVLAGRIVLVIDFRYHLVSIVAVFLALGLGLLLGSTQLAPGLLRGLQKTSQQEQSQIDSLLHRRDLLNQELARNQQFAQAAEHQLLGNLLVGEHVVIIAAPGAPGGVVSGIKQLLTKDAGATVTGEVQLQPSLFNASSATQQELTTLADQLDPIGVTLNQEASPIARAGQVLASAILTRDGPGQPAAGQRDAIATAVLNGFAKRGFLTVSNPPPPRATLAVVVIPDSPPSQNDANRPSQELVTLAQQLQQAGNGTVVTGSNNGAGPGSAIDVMRTLGRTGKMTSVDGADTPIGQIVVVQALADQLRGVSGSYGTAANASAAGPSPVPTPSPSPSASTITSNPGKTAGQGSGRAGKS
jgi:copper transport outer membrane protein MctB